MKIGIDIDGVLTNIEQFVLDYLTRYCVLNHISFSINMQNVCYDMACTFGIEKEVEHRFWKEMLPVYAKTITARPFASEVIGKLKEEGAEIYIITARMYTNQSDTFGEQVRKMVKDWLEENGILYDKLIFSKGSNESKLSEILENKIDVMIEDNPVNIQEISKIIPVICYDTSYNRNSSFSNVIRCYSFYDIYRRIKEEKIWNKESKL